MIIGCNIFFYLGQEKGGYCYGYFLEASSFFFVALFVYFQVDITNARQILQRYSYLQRLHEARVDKRLPWKDLLRESRAHNMRQQYSDQCF